MAGTAKTNDFMLGTATVMIGPADELYNLNPADHSIGLVKNFTMTSEPGYTELTQGVKNTVVHSLMTSNPVRATMEAYEFTARNLAYALGIEGADQIDAINIETTVSVAFDPQSSPNNVLSVASTTGISADDYVMILVDEEDNFMIRKVQSVTGGSPGSPPVPGTLVLVQPLEVAVAQGARVRKVNVIDVGSKDEQPFYAAKVAGVLADGQEIVVLLPKVRIVRGFNLAFTTEDYGNLPIEFTVYDLVTTDTFFTDFGGVGARIFKS